jgi:hypothetical protein
MYEVTTNEETFITNASLQTLKYWSSMYVKKAAKDGLKLHQVKFTYKPVMFIPAQSKKFTET